MLIERCISLVHFYKLEGLVIVKVYQIGDSLQPVPGIIPVHVFKVNVYPVSNRGPVYFSFPFQREKLKSLLAAKEKQHEESLRTIEALKNRFKYFEVQTD